MAYYIHRYELSPRLKLLSTAPAPYLPALELARKVVVLDPLVLVAQKPRQLLVRPYTQSFLASLKAAFSVVFYSTSLPQEVDPLLDQLDPDHSCLRLYRYHCTMDPHPVKDLTRLHNKLESRRVVALDLQEVIFPAEAGLLLAHWAGSRKDRKLLGLGKVLGEWAESQLPFF